MCLKCLKKNNEIENVHNLRLRQKTEDRLNAIRTQCDPSVSLVVRYECDWIEILRTDKKIANLVNSFKMNITKESYKNSEEIYEEILNENLQGFVHGTLAITPKLYQKLDFFPPFQERRKVSPMSHLKNFLIKNGIKIKKEMKSIPTFSQTDYHTTESILEYAEIFGPENLILYNVEEIVEAYMERSLYPVIYYTEQLRKKYDKKTAPLLNQAVKLLNNSCFGATIKVKNFKKTFKK